MVSWLLVKVRTRNYFCTTTFLYLLNAHTDGDLIEVSPYDRDDDWKEAIRVTRGMVKALNGPGRVTLEVFVHGELFTGTDETLFMRLSSLNS